MLNMLTIQEMNKILGDSTASYIPKHMASLSPAAFQIDSRKVATGDAFVAIAGERVDGHSFAEAVAASGAVLIISEKTPEELFSATPPLAVLKVESSVKALGLLARHWAKKWRSAHTDRRIIGITGTAGKTSVKESIAAVLGEAGLTSKNHMNLNNQIGLPLSMLNAAPASRFWVMEAGISEAHDMDELGEILQPDIAIVLNIGAGHLSGLGDKGVAHYKSRLLRYLASGGTALVNADYPELVKECAAHNVKTVYFSAKDAEKDVFATYLGADGPVTGRYEVTIKADGASASYQAKAPFKGEFGAENVAAIAGVASLLHISPALVQAGLAKVQLPAQRFTCESKDSFVVIDDCYNANPLSAARMLESAAGMAAEGNVPLVLVMGAMLELGAEEAKAHRQLGEQMAAAAPTHVFWKGDFYADICAGLAGAANCTAVSQPEELKAALGTLKLRGAVFLVKASRGTKLDPFAACLREMYLANA